MFKQQFRKDQDYFELIEIIKNLRQFSLKEEQNLSKLKSLPHLEKLLLIKKFKVITYMDSMR